MSGDEPRYGGWLPPRPSASPQPPPPPPAPPAQAPAQAPARPARPQALAPAQRGTPAPAPPSGPVDPLASGSLVAGVLGLLLLVFTLGLGFLFALPLSIGAWRFGGLARRRIAVNGTAGDGLASAAVLIGLAGIALAVVAMVVWTVLVLSGLSLTEFQETLQDDLRRRRG